MQRLLPPSAFDDACSQVGLTLTDDDRQRLGRYLWLLLDANTRFNLTGIKDPAEAWMRHIFDSLTLMPFATEGTLIDVGSGGGLPGIPLAICQPTLHITLLEATGKKATFLQSVVDDLQLNHVTILNDRAETAGQDRSQRQRYDIAVARAVGPMRVMLELTLPFVKLEGRVLAMKGRRVTEELDEAGDALLTLGGGNVELYEAMPGLNDDAIIVEITKTHHTPNDYPRRPGEPKTNPL